jgi:DNA-binding transcriptional LysR family regulator
MELRHLRHVLALAEHANYHRAAEALGLTQPALTKSIQQLERQLAVRLFDRLERGVVPTAFGRLVAESAREILDRVAALPDAVGQLAGQTANRLAVGAGPYVADLWLGPIVGRVLRADPRLRIEVVVDHWSELPDRLREGRIELFVANLEHVAGQSEFVVVEAPQQAAIWVARSGHPLQGRRSSRDALCDFPIVGPPAPASIRYWLEAEPVGPSPLDRKIDTVSVEFIKAIIREGDAVSLVHPEMVRGELARGEFVTLEFDAPPLTFRAGVAWLAGRPLAPPALRFVREFLRQFDLAPDVLEAAPAR